MRNDRYRKDSLTFPFSPEAGHETLMGVLIARGKEQPYLQRGGTLTGIPSNRHC